ncbi:MAG: (2Fe-2S)-binding protein [Bacteriovoracaceae bacterium]|nr:(2Fe-2S)-binding protein [Bacteriovoracaceae bacterium]
MYVCICKGITQKQVEEAVASRKGQSTKDIMRSLGVGSDCGTCVEDAIEQMLDVSNKKPRHRHSQDTQNNSRQSE